MEHLSNDHKDHPNQPKNSHKLCDETGNLVLSLTESQWKLRLPHDQNFPKEGKLCHKKEINPKEQDSESHSQRSRLESH